MSASQLEILKRDSLEEGGFAGLREHRLVKGRRLWGEQTDGSWDGVGNFVYLADARFNPKGETHMHPHKEIDVISVMVEGRIAHEGSLEHGESLETYEAQVQRAGGEGFSHNEVNPDSEKNRLLQLWVKPEVKGEPAGYRKFSPAWGQVTRIYGGEEGKTASFPAKTTIDVAMLNKGQTLELSGNYLAYLSKGAGKTSGESLEDGDLFKGDPATFIAEEDVQLIIMKAN